MYKTCVIATALLLAAPAVAQVPYDYDPRVVIISPVRPFPLPRSCCSTSEVVREQGFKGYNSRINDLEGAYIPFPGIDPKEAGQVGDTGQ